MRRSGRARSALLRLVPLLLFGCGEGDSSAGGEVAAEPPVAFDSTRICIATATDTLTMPVELAASEEQRAYGLMERERLEPESGMLFTFPEPQPADNSFWMYRTRIPLDIAYIDATGEIRAVQSMPPCTSPDPRWCPQYPAGVPFSSALEANQGFFAERGIGPGARVLRAGEQGCPRAG